MGRGWRKRLAIGGLALGAGAANAGSVTLYGVADQAVEYAHGSSSVARVEDGRQAASRFGMRGVEDLGGNLKAIFVAEAGFRMDTGAEFFGNGSIFGRQVFVGLKGNWGEVRMGRQYTPAFYVIARLDPFSLNAAVSPFTLVAKSSAQGTGYVPYASRVDNAVTYNTPDWNGLTASATYAFGEVPGEMQQASTYGANVQYFRGPVYLMYGFQASTNKPATAAIPQGKPDPLCQHRLGIPPPAAGEGNAAGRAALRVLGRAQPGCRAPRPQSKRQSSSPRVPCFCRDGS